MSVWSVVAESIEGAAGIPFRLRERRAVGGGCINDTWLISDGEHRFFVKTNASAGPGMFQAEAAGLEALAATASVRVPRPVTFGTAGREAFLVLEHLDLGGRCDGHELGLSLAALHRNRGPQFGFAADNFIGTTPQPNRWHDDWAAFFRDRRLGHQLELARQKGAGSRLLARGAQLLEGLPRFFADYQPVPSLLHGDLWSGNAAATRQGQPVVFDPAVYYGDREADLAMTELFGGFSARFYAAYEAAWPLDPGYAARKDLYNLYHVLNHYLLFGGGYGAQAEDMIDRLLAELR